MRRELSAYPLRSLLAVLLLLTAACWPSAQTAAQSNERAWLEQAPDLFIAASATVSRAERALLLDARSAENFAESTVAGSHNIPWQLLVDGERSGRLLDDAAELSRRLAGVGALDNEVIVFGSWAGTNPLNAWGEEGRLWWALKTAGYTEVRVVYGGFAALADAGATLAPGLRQDAPTDAAEHAADETSALPVVLSPSTQWRASADDVAAVASGDGAVLDTRTSVEFAGATLYGEREGGHIPGAVQLWWRDVFANEDDLLSPDELDALLQSHGATRDAPLVAYCTGGIRSAFVVMLASTLGYDARNYDGSIWEWTNALERPLE